MEGRIIAEGIPYRKAMRYGMRPESLTFRQLAPMLVAALLLGIIAGSPAIVQPLDALSIYIVGLIRVLVAMMPLVRHACC
jgi:hypothetical protein